MVQSVELDVDDVVFSGLCVALSALTTEQKRNGAAVIDLGGGAFFPAVALINGWRLRFPVAGNYLITGNLKGDVLLGAGVALERQTSAAYATTSVGGAGLPPVQLALLQRVLDNTNLIPAIV